MVNSRYRSWYSWGVPVRLGIIGCGGWGVNHVRTAQRLRNAELRVVCDAADHARSRAVETAPLVPQTSDFQQVLKDPDIDAVIIATPADTHASLVASALACGKHVLVEKPFVLDPRVAPSLVDLAEARGLVLMVGHLLRYHPTFNALERITKSGEIGDVHYVYAERVNLGVVRTNENALWSLAPHDVSMICALMSEPPIEVSATGQSFLQPGIEDVVFVTIRFRGGTLGHVHVSWLDPHKHRRLTVVGSRKMMVFDDMASGEKLRIFDKGVTAGPTVSFDDFLSVRHGDIQIPLVENTEPLLVEHQHFVDCINEARTPKTDGREATRVLLCLDAAQRSLKNGGQPVSLLP